mmetsp:Transcript_55773/g.127606  ORF Transcript_55773/g.127606 Transcript_55773/m.127606 type:complete len:240 (-) Transcript_55773:65-784(-)
MLELMREVFGPLEPTVRDPPRDPPQRPEDSGHLHLGEIEIGVRAVASKVLPQLRAVLHVGEDERTLVSSAARALEDERGRGVLHALVEQLHAVQLPRHDEVPCRGLGAEQVLESHFGRLGLEHQQVRQILGRQIVLSLREPLLQLLVVLEREGLRLARVFLHGLGAAFRKLHLFHGGRNVLREDLRLPVIRLLRRKLLQRRAEVLAARHLAPLLQTVRREYHRLLVCVFGEHVWDVVKD